MSQSVVAVTLLDLPVLQGSGGGGYRAMSGLYKDLIGIRSPTLAEAPISRAVLGVFGGSQVSDICYPAA